MKYDPNAPETEDDAIRSESLRRQRIKFHASNRSKVRPASETQQAQTSESPMPQRSTLEPMESPSLDKQNM